MYDRSHTIMKNSPKAFTLIEMLVVIAIIMLLMAILVPTLTTVQQRALRNRDATNLQQIGIAALIYAQENNGRMVPPFDVAKKDAGIPTHIWAYPLSRYMERYANMNITEFMGVVHRPGSIFYAPGVKEPGAGRTYGMNTQQTNSRWDFRLANVPSPSSIIHIGPTVPANTEWMSSSDRVPGWGAQMAFRFGKLTGFLYVDGHVSFHSADQVVFNPPDGDSRFKWW